MNVALISPYADVTGYCIRILSSVIKQAGHKTRILFLPKASSLEKFSPTYVSNVFSKVIGFCESADLIGISLYSCHFPSMANLTRKIREQLDIPVVWGGKHPSAKPEEALQYADMVCVGEGETAIVEILNRMSEGKPFYDVSNFFFTVDGKLIKNPLMSLTHDLNSIPYPDYSMDEHYIWDDERHGIVPFDETFLYKLLKKNDPQGEKLSTYNTMTSLGCPYRCTYCFSFRGMYKGEKYLRFRSIDKVIDEIDTMKRKFPEIGKVLFSDDNFFARTTEDIKGFASIYKEKVGLPMHCLAAPQNVSEEKLACMVDAGLSLLQIGVETGSEKIKKLFQREVPNSVILNAANVINKFAEQVDPHYDIILDVPTQKSEDLLDTINLLLKFPRPYHINRFSLSIFPGTGFYEDAVRKGLKFDEHKEVETRKVTYLNLVLALFNCPVPKFIIEILVSKSVIRFLKICRIIKD